MKFKRSTHMKFALTALITFGFVGGSMAIPLLSKAILDCVGFRNVEALPMLFLQMLITMVVFCICEVCRPLARTSYLNDVKHLYRMKLLDGIYKSMHEGISSQKEAEILSMYNNDIPMIVTDFYMSIVTLMYYVGMAVMATSTLVYINPYITVISVTSYAFLASVPLFFKTLLQNRKNAVSDTLKKFNVRLKDNIVCNLIIKSYLAEKETKNKVAHVSLETNAATYSYEKAESAPFALASLLMYGSDFLILLVSSFLIYKGEMTMGGLLAAIQISAYASGPISNLSRRFNAINSVLPIKRKMDALIRQSEKLDAHAKTPVQKIESLQVVNATVTRDGSDILKHATITFEYGKKYLIVGKNGSGKSTLLKLVNGNILDYEGEVTVNGSISCKDVQRESFYNNVAIDYQDSYLFTGTIDENITMYKPHSKGRLQEIKEFLQISDLSTQDEEAVHHLSGGEKQRIALARAMLKEPRFLLLDEAFSAMDISSRLRIEKFLLEQDFAILSISHTYTPETIHLYDKIVILQNGAVLECEKYDQLSEMGKQFIHFD